MYNLLLRWKVNDKTVQFIIVNNVKGSALDWFRSSHIECDNIFNEISFFPIPLHQIIIATQIWRHGVQMNILQTIIQTKSFLQHNFQLQMTN